MKNLRAELKSKIIEYVFPQLEQWGFEEKPSRERAVGSSSTMYPFGTWERGNSNGSLDLIEFKFDKMAVAKFTFNFAHIPKGGGYGDYGLNTQNESQASGFGEFGRYRPKLFTVSNPVSLSFTKWRVKNENDAVKSIQKWMLGLTQVEDWFKYRKVGAFLVTVENLPRGVRISRGFPDKLIFKSTSLSFMKFTKNVESYEEALSLAKHHYAEKGQALNLSKSLCWKYDGLS